MNGYYDIHCPFCGSVMSPMDIKFSISEFVKSIVDTDLEEKYNDGILGVLGENINVIIDNDFLWDMSPEDIQDCYVGDMFVLSGENLLRRFGTRAIELFRDVTDEMIEAVDSSIVLMEGLEDNPEVKELVEEILRNIPREKLLRADIDIEDRNAAVFQLVKCATTNEVLFKIQLEVKGGRDDRNNIIPNDIRDSQNRVFSKSKRCCNCGNELSKMSGKSEEKIICFIGSPAAGKSAYLAAAVDKLTRTGAVKYGIKVEFDDESSDYIAFREACLAPYQNGFAITKTNQDTFPQLSMMLENDITKERKLYTFVDMPGETFIDENGFNISDALTNRKIIKYADVVWFCASAKQLFSSRIGGFRIAKKDGTIQNEEMKDLTTLGQNTIKFANGMFGDGEKRPAVALILTKSDLLANFIMGNVFSGDFTLNKSMKQVYFRTICSVPHVNNPYSELDFEFCDGEPNTLEYMDNGRFRYQRFLNDAKGVTEFIQKHGEPYSEVFLGNVASAFQKKLCPCFSEASYGRDTVERYSVENAVKYILSKKSQLNDNQYEDLKYIFGEAELAAFESGEGKLPVVKEPDYLKFILDLYRWLNPIYPFGIMSILMWTFAYTGFVPCVESDGENWNELPRSGEIFEQLKSRLIFETEGGNILVRPKEPAKKKGLFGKMFG